MPSVAPWPALPATWPFCHNLPTTTTAVQVRLDAARAKATSIAAQEDMPMSSKMKEIEKLYAKARAGGGAKGKKGGKAAGGLPRHSRATGVVV